MKIVLGKKYKDKVSGFTGIAISCSTFLNGCSRIGIQSPIDEKGKLPDEKWFDDMQLELVDEGIVDSVPKVVEKARTGGPGSGTSMPDGMRR